MTSIKEFFGSEGWQKFRGLTLPRDCVLGGVCAALGTVTPLAPWMWRVLFCAVALVWGVGVAAYVILWISIPSEGKKES